jgi:hypothetical protein
MTVVPNLVIAGAPKCGTSSLFRWLADHPEACGSTPKETFYLMDAGHPLARPEADYHRHGLEGYGRYFTHCRDGARIVFEATTHYIYQRTALEVLSRLRPRPQIVFVLRKPSERVYSSFQYTKNNLARLSPEVSFSRFVELARGGADDAVFRAYAGRSAYVLKNDIKYSRYVEYVRPWVERFGRARVHVLLFEEMRANPRAFMRDLAGRLGVDASFYDAYDFAAKNETFSLKRLSLHRRVMRLNGLIPRGRLRGLLKGAYLKAQSAGASAGAKTPEDVRALAELDGHFEPFNRQLADELGLELSAWG